MSTRTLPRHTPTTVWAHPYSGLSAWAVCYADGGDSDAGTTGEGKPGTGDGDNKADESDTGDADETDWKAEAEKWKAQSRKHEDRAKANAGAAKERDELRRQGMSDAEKLADEAAAKARVEERTKLAGRLARSGFLAAAAGRVPNASTVADDLNLARYVGEDGEIDEKGLAELVDRLAPKTTTSDTGTGASGSAGGGERRGFGQGARGTAGGDKPGVASGRDLWAERHKKNTTT
ncbi:hypothetical protein [Streptomyces sp. NPDC088674]|uniref:hypothetical protein n=1 Tax=Streptomyces sp. NPDC088674 TaxID=3365869 RepID=UPI003821C435